MTRSGLLIPVAILYALGLCLIFNTTSADALDRMREGMHGALLRQMAYGVLGAGFGWLLYRTGYRKLLEISPKLIAGCALLLVMALLPGVGIMANGSRRWVGIGGFSVQPSEFVKLMLPLYVIAHAKEHLRHTALVCAAVLGLIFVEPNNGTCGVIGLSLLLLCWLLEVPAKYWALPMACCMVVGGAVALQMPYVASRIETYLHPERDVRGKGHQPYQAKIAVGSGGFFGKGPGKSLQKMSYLPEAQNDYIAAIFAEEYGFVGMMLLVVCYAWLAYEGSAIAYRAGDGWIVAAVLTWLISFQAFLNLGVVSGLLPSTGLNLPFFSQGGSSLVANCGVIGVLASVGGRQCA